MNTTRSMVEVGVAMVLRDQFTREAGRISSSFTGLMRDMSNWNQAVTRSYGGVLDASTQMLTGFGKAYSHMANVYDQIFLTSQMSGATLAQEKELLQLAKDVNAITPLTSADIASGMKYLAMAGNNVQQIKDMISPAAELASIFSMPLGGKGGVADLMTNIMQTFNLPSEEARKTVDQLAVAVTSANMSLQDLSQSFLYSGAEFRNAKISVGDAAAAIGVLGNQGIQASSAGVALANVMRYLTLSITGQRQQGDAALRSLGIDPASLVDAQGNLLRLDKIVSMIGERLRGQRGVDISAAIFNLVGVRGSRGLSALLQDYWSGANKLTELMEKVRGSEGMVAETTQKRLQTPAGLLDQIKSNWENFIVTQGENIMNMVNLLLKAGVGILRFVTKISETWGGRFLSRVVATGTALITVVSFFKTLSNTIKTVSSIQSIASNQTRGMSAAASLANKQFLIMEQHMVRLVNYMRQMVQLQMLASGLIMNKAGRVISKKTGKYVGLPNVGIPEMMMGGMIASDLFSDDDSSETGKKKSKNKKGNPVNTTMAPPIANASKGLLRGGLGGILGRLGPFLSRALGFIGGGWGLAIAIALPILSDALEWLTDAVNENTSSQKNKDKDEKDPLAIKAENERRFLEAVRMAIREGMKDSTVNILVDGQPVGEYHPGSKADYTGRALGIE